MRRISNSESSVGGGWRWKKDVRESEKLFLWILENFESYCVLLEVIFFFFLFCFGNVGRSRRFRRGTWMQAISDDADGWICFEFGVGGEEDLK